MENLTCNHQGNSQGGGLSTLEAIALVEENARNPKEKEWAQALRHGYEKKLEPVYSVDYTRDPAVATFLRTSPQI